MYRLKLLAAIATLLIATGAFAQNAATDWNAIALQVIVNAPCTTSTPPCPNPLSRPGPTGLLDTAMVQAAVYDAVESITRNFRPYHVRVPGATGSTSAAVAKATHDVLVSRLGSAAVIAFLDAKYHDYLATHGIAEDDPGVAVGAAAAAGIIAVRTGDGSFPNNPPAFTGGTNPGEWRPTPPAFASMLAPWLAHVTPFTLSSPSQFRPVAPPPLSSKRYAVDYNEVKAMGRATGSSRNAEQTSMALFFNANYIVLWNQTVQKIATAQALNIDDSARLFALVNLAMSDAVIAAWDSKLHFAFWRPLTAIQNGDNDGNPDTVGDPGWLPLIVNPAYPDYTSGANNVTAAATRSLALFFGSDQMSFTVRTTNTAALPPQEQERHYNRFSDVAADVVNGRIYEGIHFRSADVQARKQGRHVAQWVFGHFLRPVDDDEQDEHADEGDAE